MVIWTHIATSSTPTNWTKLSDVKSTAFYTIFIYLFTKLAPNCDIRWTHKLTDVNWCCVMFSKNSPVLTLINNFLWVSWWSEEYIPVSSDKRSQISHKYIPNSPPLNIIIALRKWHLLQRMCFHHILSFSAVLLHCHHSLSVMSRCSWMWIIVIYVLKFMSSFMNYYCSTIFN